MIRTAFSNALSVAIWWLILALVLGAVFPWAWVNLAGQPSLPVFPTQLAEIVGQGAGWFYLVFKGPSQIVIWYFAKQYNLAADPIQAAAELAVGQTLPEVQWPAFLRLMILAAPAVALFALAISLVLAFIAGLGLRLPSLGRAAPAEGEAGVGASLLGAFTSFAGLATAVVVFVAAGLLVSRFMVVRGAGTPAWERVLNSQVPCDMGTVPMFEVAPTTVVTFTQQVQDLLPPVRAAQACIGAGRWTSVDAQRELLTALFALEDTRTISSDVQAHLAGGGIVPFWDEVSVWVYAYAEAYERPTTSAQFHVNALVFEGQFRQAEAIYLAHAGGTIGRADLARATELAAASFTRSKALAEEQAAGLLPYTADINDLQRLNLTVVSAGRLLQTLQSSR